MMGKSTSAVDGWLCVAGAVQVGAGAVWVGTGLGSGAGIDAWLVGEDDIRGVFCAVGTAVTVPAVGVAKTGCAVLVGLFG